MEFSLIEWVRELADVQIGVHAKMVAVMLGRHANEKGECFPGFLTLCRETGVSKREMTRSIRELEASGIVIVRGGHGAKYCYELVPHRRRLKTKPVPHRHQTGATQASVEDQTGATQASDRCHTGTGTGATQAPEVAQGSSPRSRERAAAPPRARAHESSPFFARFCALWESEFGQTLSPNIVDEADEFERKTGGNVEWIEYGFKECVDNNVRKLSYLRRVIDGVVANGGINGPGPTQGVRAAERGAPKHSFASIRAKQDAADAQPDQEGAGGSVSS